jgi:cytochrome b
MNQQRVLVWDAPVRVFHWMLAVSFLGAFLTAESERWRDVHVMLGYTVAGLLAFRLVWGLVGSRYARFSSFAFGPGKVAAYLKSLLGSKPEHHLGHNPAGSWAIYGLLSTGVIASVSGWLKYQEIGGDAMEEVHEFSANLMLAVVVVHLAGVVVSSFLHRENLVRSMLTGYKSGTPIAKTRAHWLVAAALATAVALGWMLAGR